MHLARMLDLRPIPAAGVAVAVTRRCPLACRHCSTASLPRGEQYPDQPIRRFVASFADAEPPGVLLLTGGEPLLRPKLVTGLATAARRAATASCVVTGMFFATPDGRP
ncbi:MAG: radical SAM protein, partial [Actinocrinis sp.]